MPSAPSVPWFAAWGLTTLQDCVPPSPALLLDPTACCEPHHAPALAGPGEERRMGASGDLDRHVGATAGMPWRGRVHPWVQGMNHVHYPTLAFLAAAFLWELS